MTHMILFPPSGPDLYLNLVFHLPGEVLNDEGWLHDGGAEEVPVVLMLLFELGQQGLARGVGEAGKI